MEEEGCQRWGKDNKDGVRRHTPFQTEGRAAATMDDRSRIEEDEVIVTLPGLRPGPGVRYGRADLGSSLFLIFSLMFDPHPRQDHPGGIFLCGNKSYTKIEILG